jgi:hypothetical protein
MIKSLLICAVASASVIACSTAGPPRSENRTAATAPTQPCVPETASRLPMRPGVCTSAPGRSYSNQDLDRTGQIDVADALQMLDPSITVHH